VSARYWVLVSDDLMDEYDPERLPEGVRFTSAAPAPPLPPYALGRPAAAQWRQVEDDSADPALDGRQVELILGRQEPPEQDDDGKTPPGGKPAQPRQKRSPARTVIIERRLLG
jgi:hypothetical protein